MATKVSLGENHIMNSSFEIQESVVVLYAVDIVDMVSESKISARLQLVAISWLTGQHDIPFWSQLKVARIQPEDPDAHAPDLVAIEVDKNAEY